MAEHFLTKTRVDLGRCIEVAGIPAVERYDQLRAQLGAKIGPEAAKLFAEPLVSKGNDQAASTISWYCDRSGDGVPFGKLDPAGQQKAGAILADRLKALSVLLDDAETGPLVAASLYIGSSADIRQGQRPKNGAAKHTEIRDRGRRECRGCDPVDATAGQPP